MTLPLLDPVTLLELQEPVRERLVRVEHEMRRMIEADFPLITDVNDHLLRMRGKMFRPTLALLADEATGSTGARGETFAAIIELIHLATLVHDDAVDHSALRRGMPTINAMFSHQISVIMGDFLYSRAVIELVAMADLEALSVLGRVTNEMAIGEMRQLLVHDPLTFTEEQYDLLIRAKTASLISGACAVGGLGAAPAARAALARFGELVGMAFQIVDDLLDYTALTEVTGKPSGLDLREHKVTLPLIHALPNFSADQRADLAALMASPKPSEAQIASVIQAVTTCGGLAYARDRAGRIMAEAEQALQALPPSPAREVLRASLGFVLERRR